MDAVYLVRWLQLRDETQPPATIDVASNNNGTLTANAGPIATMGSIADFCANGNENFIRDLDIHLLTDNVVLLPHLFAPSMLPVQARPVAFPY